MIELNTSLIEVIAADLGDPPRRGHQPFWSCPFHSDRDPSFTVMPGGQRWKCFGCDRSGDAIDYVKERQGLSFKEAVAFLRDRSGSFYPREHPFLSTTRHTPERAVAQAAFSRHGSEIVADCVERLYSPQGVRAFQWLRRRGLRPEFIRYGQIGYNPMDRVVSGIFLKRGITIPWTDGDKVQGIKIRRPASNPKYLWVKGQARSGLYNGTSIVAGCPTLLTEGELDALLGRQEFGDLVNVATLGSASDTPDDRALHQLLGSPLILICYDADPAGQRGFDRWSRATRRVRSLHLPEGMDLTDLFRVTANLRHWLEGQLRRLGLSITLHPTLKDNHLDTNELSVG